MNFPRNDNGVKIRRDGQGDGFANCHRVMLPRDCFMQDVDAMVGNMFFAKDSGNKLFAEYVIGSKKERDNQWIVACGWLALFDRKYDSQAINDNPLTTAVYLHACRVFSAYQPLGMPCRFFFAIGPNSGPWKVQEVNVESGKIEMDPVYVDATTRWDPVWSALNLLETRKRLTEWVRSNAGVEFRSRPDPVRFDYEPGSGG